MEYIQPDETPCRVEWKAHSPYVDLFDILFVGIHIHD